MGQPDIISINFGSLVRLYHWDLNHFKRPPTGIWGFGTEMSNKSVTFSVDCTGWIFVVAFNFFGGGGWVVDAPDPFHVLFLVVEDLAVGVGSFGTGNRVVALVGTAIDFLTSFGCGTDFFAGCCT